MRARWLLTTLFQLHIYLQPYSTVYLLTSSSRARPYSMGSPSASKRARAPSLEAGSDTTIETAPKSGGLRQRFLKHVADNTAEGQDVSLNLRFRKNVSCCIELTTTDFELISSTRAI